MEFAKSSAKERLVADLGNGLILRRSTAADAEPLAEFTRMVFRDPGVVEPDEGAAAWVRDLLGRPHPTFHPDDFTIVEEVATGRIISECCLISQTWLFAGIPVKVGRPELVGTAPEYRNRGLIRAQFDQLHAWSLERGESLQAITGIPYYYRQFGYEMAMDLGGGRIGYHAGVPMLKEGEEQPYRLRRATEDDASLFVACDGHAHRRSLVTCERDEATWRFEMTGKSARNANRLDLYVIETAEGRPVGAVGINCQLWGARLGVQYLEVLPGVSWLALAPSVLRGVWAEGLALAERESKTLEGVQYSLGSDHPFYRVNYDRLGHIRRPYAWYLRVPDMAGFVRLIAPVLEQRLAESVATGHTGELKLSFYRSGLRIRFEDGHVREAENWAPDDSYFVGLPGLTFIQLLFGHRTLDELRQSHADCVFNNDDGKPLLDALFPKHPSTFWPLS